MDSKSGHDEGTDVSWCDKLSSTPTIGIKLDARHKPASAILEALSPLLDQHYIGDKQEFTLDRQEAFDVVFSANTGIQYSVTPTRLAVSYTHKLKLKYQSAALPIWDFISQPKPFTNALPESADKLVDAALLLPEIEHRRLLQIGIVSATNVADEDMPPGFVDILAKCKEVWGDVAFYTYCVTVLIGETDGYRDRCIHTFSLAEDPDAVPVVSLDWQRIYKDPRIVRKGSLVAALNDGQRDALAYFERLAIEGAGHV